MEQQYFKDQRNEEYSGNKTWKSNYYFKENWEGCYRGQESIVS